MRMKKDSFQIIIACLGLLLTAASVIASYAQYKAADLQAKAAIVALQPQLEIRTILEKKDSEKYTDIQILISSDGGPVYNLEIDNVTWFTFNQGTSEKARLYLYGYYFFSQGSGKTKGDLYTIKGNKNNQKFVDFLDLISQSIPFGFYLEHPKTLLKIKFTDALKKEHLEFFTVGSKGVSRLSFEAGNTEYMQSQQASIKNSEFIDLDHMNFSDKRFSSAIANTLTKLK